RRSPATTARRDRSPPSGSGWPSARPNPPCRPLRPDPCTVRVRYAYCQWPGGGGMQPQRSRRTGARRLTLDAIVDAAAALIEAEGFEALTMRRIADEYAVGVVTLHGYVGPNADI